MSEWSTHLSGISDGYNSAADSLRQLCSLASVEAANSSDNDSAGRILHDLGRAVLSSSRALGEELSGLGSMSDAVAMMKGDPSMSSVTWGLVLNIMHVLATQLTSHHTEVTAAVTTAKARLGTMKTATAKSIGRTPSPSSSQPPSAPATPASRGPSAPLRKVEEPPQEDELENPAKKKKKKAKAVAHPDDIVSAPTLPLVEVVAAPEEEPKKKKKKKKAAVEDVHSESETTHPADLVPPVVAKSKKAAASPTTSVTPTGLERPRWEPDFFRIQGGSINDALGNLVNSSKPNDVFSPPESIIGGQRVLLDYFVALDPPGRIGAILANCWVNADAGEVQRFAQDVLDLDDVTAEHFSYVGRDISMNRDDDFTGVPGCGWRCITPTSSDSDPRRLYTMYICVDHPAEKMNRSLLIHDVVVMDKSKKEEVVTVITPTPISKSQQANVAHVVVYAASVSKRRMNTEATMPYGSAIGAMTKELLEQCGYTEIDDDDVHGEDDDSTSIPVVDATVVGGKIPENFVDPNSLKTKEKKSVLDMALGIGKTIALAPVTATKKVSSAVTGVAEHAMLRQTDAMFQEWFPHLASESVVDTYNCALSDGPVLKQGVMYVTKHWIAFNATVFSKRLSINFDDVKEIRKAKFMKIFDNSIEIETYDNEAHFFTSYIGRDTAFNVMHEAWRNSGN